MKKIIQHAVYGKGIVLKKRFYGSQILVEFEDGIQRWINAKDVFDPFDNILKTDRFQPKTLNNQSEKKSEIKWDELNRVDPYEKFISRSIIESLRMGIFIDKFIERFTFGRKNEVNFVKNWLNNDSDGALIISGDYGIGKTHLLKYLEKKLVEEEWATSMIQFDSVSLPLNKPKNLYEAIIENFRYPRGSFKDFLKELAMNNRSYLLDNHLYIKAILNRIREGKIEDYCWLWIKGKLHHTGTTKGLPPIYTYSTASNIFCYILSGIGYALKHVLGLKGFIILFDEAENIDPYWYTTYQRKKGWNFLRGLILMAKNSEFLLNEEINQILAKNQTTIELWGAISQLQYYSKRPLRYLWNIPCSVKLIFAFTYNEALFSSPPLKNLKILDLKNLDVEALDQIAEKILEIYKKAYGINESLRLSKSFLRETLNLDSVRLYIKGVVEYLDLKRFSS
ncbi:MAG: BREX system ATP-binding domain-containing protein [Promethearchaeota archaeon]